MSTYYLAVDIGASSGRHIISECVDGTLITEEVYRFENTMVKRGDTLCWDLEKLFSEILKGMKMCADMGKIPVSMGIDTWGVDYVLLDGRDEIIGNAVAYRDKRTEGMDKIVSEIVPLESLYQRTGIQKQIFNTIYQLTAQRFKFPSQLKKARTFLMIPDYFNFLLTGVKTNEYTNATTTQLVNARAKTWDEALIRQVGLPADIFKEPTPPATAIGRLLPGIRGIVGYDCEVVLPATHDTGSAVAAVPAPDHDFIYLSSGTWSLIGTEKQDPDCSMNSMRHNFTNEGGIEYRYRHLKNIMGLWMIQSIRRELAESVTFGDLMASARRSLDFDTTIDVNDKSFLAPDSMISAIKLYCQRHDKKPPETTGMLLACVTRSLAKSYADAIAEIEELDGRKYARLHIVGGGTLNALLNDLTAQMTGKEVLLGPVEATAVGNIIAQMLYACKFTDLNQARACVRRSFKREDV